jgi:hypothetical protein
MLFIKKKEEFDNKIDIVRTSIMDLIKERVNHYITSINYTNYSKRRFIKITHDEIYNYIAKQATPTFNMETKRLR